jgi:hypothetical protein
MSHGADYGKKEIEMNNSRSIFWLTFALLLCVALHFILPRGAAVSPAVPGARNFSMLDPDKVSAVRISTPGQADMVVTNTPSGWRFCRPYNAAADARAVERVVDLLVFAQAQETITDGELSKLGRKKDDFGLNVPSVEVELFSDKGNETFKFGAFTPDKSGVYALSHRIPGVSIAGTNIFAAITGNIESFRRRAFFSNPVESVSFVTVKRAGGFMRFFQEENVWKMSHPHEGLATAEKIKELLSAVMTAQAVRFVWPSGSTNENTSISSALLAGYGLDRDSAMVLTIGYLDGTESHLYCGKDAGEKEFYALTSGADEIVTASNGIKKLLEKDASYYSDRRLFAIDPELVARFSLSKNGVVYMFSRNKSGDWRIDSPISASASAQEVEKLLKRLCSLTHDDTVTKADDSIEVVIPPLSSAKVSQSAALGEIRLENMRSRNIVSIDPSAVRRVAVWKAGHEKPASVVYDAGRNSWSVESLGGIDGGVVDVVAVKKMLEAFKSLAAEKIVSLKADAQELKLYGLANPRMTVAIDVQGGERTNILLGDTVVEGRSFASKGVADAIFVLSPETELALSTPIVVSGAENRKDKDEIR